MKNQFTEAQLKWLEALESGEYEQAQGELRSQNSFCCLGVACEISGLGEWDKRERYMGNLNHLPRIVQEHLDMYDSEGIPKEQSFGVSLAERNDNGSTFKEIAAHLRKHPEQYFTNFEAQ